MHIASATSATSFTARHQERFDAWVEAERGRFALWLPVAATAGVVGYFAGTSEPALWSGPAVAAVALLAALLLRSHRTGFGIASLALAAALGFSASAFATWRAPPSMEVPRTASMVSGEVEAVEALPTGQRVMLRAPRFADGPAQSRLVRIRLHKGDTIAIEVGDRLAVRTMLMRPAPPAYPGGWDLQRDDFFAGIGAYGSALSAASVTSAASRPGLGWLRTLREAIAGRITNGIAGPEGTIAAMLMTGLGTAIPPDDRAAFRDSGLAHLLAIAGLHIGIVMATGFAVTRFVLTLSERAALFWSIRIIAACAALLLGASYLLMTGAHVPILRSFAMACLVTLGVLAGRRALSLRGLGLAMGAIALAYPSEVTGVSFQMSFSAVLALIVGYAALRERLQALHGDGGRGRRLAGHVVGLALTSALAGSASAPFGAYHFGDVQIYFVLANMLAVPITALLVMPAGLLAIALMPLHLEFLALRPMGWGITAILAVARGVAAWPSATVAVPPIADWGIVMFSFGLAWLGIWRTRIKFAGIVVMALGLASAVSLSPPDVIVSADARLIGIREGSILHVQKTNGGSAFTEQEWLHHWGLSAATAPDCPNGACALQPNGLLLRRPATSADCSAGVLISAEPIEVHCPDEDAVIDRFSVWRAGATAVWLTADGARVSTDHDHRGNRPWVLGPPLAGRVPPNTHPAKVEELPAE
jgi:competence protein ComEC